MKATLLLFFTSVLSIISVDAQNLARDQALQIGVQNDGTGNGKFWFERGDSSPPFVHAGHIVISQGSQISLTLKGATSGLGVDAPYDDGSQTRLDFFTSSNGRGWVTAHVLKPEIKSTRPEPPRDERPSTHKALCSAAELAIREGDLDFLKALLKRGLQINEALDFEDGDTLLHEVVYSDDLAIVKFLLANGADPNVRNRYGDRPIDNAISVKEEALCKLLARPNGNEGEVDGIPTGLIEEVLPHQSSNEIFFVSWNGQDPSLDVLAEIHKTVPKAMPASRMETLKRRPLGAHSWYRDQESNEFGSLIEVTLGKAGDAWAASVRMTVGPVMAGGGWKGKARKEYGYWYTYDVDGWDE
jgi:hypothetical protein